MAGVVLQRCVPMARASMVATGSMFPHRRAVSVRVSAPKGLICRASFEGGSVEETGPERRMVFKDEQNEIICYYDENGDVVCEGWDEGPHFQPDPQQPTLRRRRKFSRIVQARGADETVDFKNIKERMREQLQEVTKESFDSSEL